MSDKLNQSLDDILKDRKKTNAPKRRSTRARAVKPAAVAVSNGVTKGGRANKAAPKKAAPAAPTTSGTSKIIVSNLPVDVTETHIKEYFVSTIGSVRKVLLTYGPQGQSRGVATVIFNGAKSASEAAKLLDGTKVDGRPMRVEVVLTAKDAPQPAPIKALADRVNGNKKEAKGQTKGATGKAKTAKGKPATKATARGRNAGRPKRKTADELDAEMTDYFGGNSNGATNGAAPATNGAAAAGGDAMEEEIV